jgi:putative transcriptional regulator
VSIEKDAFEGKISKAYVKKEILKNNIGLIGFMLILEITYIILYFIDPYFGIDWLISLTNLTVILPYVAIALISAWFFSAYVKNFSYIAEENEIIINHGVFTKTRGTIPYKRIQNINIVNGVFDRMFKTYTVKIETAGHSPVSTGKSRGIAPEGYIPGLKDPYIIENKIMEMITRSTSGTGAFEEKIFKPEELAFDNFISYILSKMREGEMLKTSIKTLRESMGLTASQLAEKVNVPIQTIKYLEEGRYSPSLLLAYKIAEVLKCKVEDLFELA